MTHTPWSRKTCLSQTQEVYMHDTHTRAYCNSWRTSNCL